MSIALFFDSGSLKRAWSLNITEQALSGTDGMIIQVYSYLKENGYDITMLATSAPSSPTDGIEVVGNLVQAYTHCTQHAIDILVYITNFDPIHYDLLKLATTDKTRLIAWAHNNPDFGWCNAAWACPAFYRLVTVSNAQRLSLAAHPIFKRTVVIPNFLEVDSFSAYNQQNTPLTSNTISYVGALKRDKGFHHLAAVWPAFRAKFPQMQLDVCGSPGLYQSNSVLGSEGIAEKDFEEMILSHLGGTRASAEQLGVRFLGSIPKKALYDQIKRSRLVVVNLNMPKDGSIETFCVSAAEALLLGVPVIGAAAGGLLEVVGHEKGGLLVKDGQELLTALTTLATENEKGRNLAQKGGERIVEFFSKSDSMARWAALLSGNTLPAMTKTDVELRDRSYYVKSLIRELIPLPFIIRMRKIARKAAGLAN